MGGKQTKVAPSPVPRRILSSSDFEKRDEKLMQLRESYREATADIDQVQLVVTKHNQQMARLKNRMRPKMALLTLKGKTVAEAFADGEPAPSPRTTRVVNGRRVISVGSGSTSTSPVPDMTDGVVPFVDDEDTTTTAIHAQDRKARQAEMFAGAKAGHVESVRSLIACNVDVNFGIAPHGATPLYAASQRGQHDMVRLLLEHGANPNIKRTDDGGTPLHASAESGHSNIVTELLSAGASVNATTVRVQTPLLAAVELALASEPHFTCVRLLLAAYADTAIADEDGGFPLVVAAALGNLDVVEALVASGADLNQLDPQGCTPLYSSACFAKKHVVAYLVSKGADVNRQTLSGVSPLFIAAQNGSHSSCELLLGAPGIERDATNQVGRTALHAACQAKHASIVQLLVTSGCSPTVAGQFGTAEQEMTTYGVHDGIVKILNGRGMSTR